MDITAIWHTILPFLQDGIRYGLTAGALAGGITWVIINNPDSLFRAVGGFLLGAVLGGLLYGNMVAATWGRILAAAGSPLPHRLALDVIILALKMFTTGLMGALLLLFINAPIDAILGGLTGAVTGILLGALLRAVIQWMGFPAESLLYPPLIGLLVLIGYTIYGSI